MNISMVLGKVMHTTREGFSRAEFCIYVLPPADVAVDIRFGNSSLEGAARNRQNDLFGVVA